MTAMHCNGDCSQRDKQSNFVGKSYAIWDSVHAYCRYVDLPWGENWKTNYREVVCSQCGYRLWIMEWTCTLRMRVDFSIERKSISIRDLLCEEKKFNKSLMESILIIIRNDSGWKVLMNYSVCHKHHSVWIERERWDSIYLVTTNKKIEWMEYKTLPSERMSADTTWEVSAWKKGFAWHFQSHESFVCRSKTNV